MMIMIMITIKKDAMVSDSSLGILCFSKDRPYQLEQLLKRSPLSTGTASQKIPYQLEQLLKRSPLSTGTASQKIPYQLGTASQKIL